MKKRLVGLDIETYDPCLKETGWSWKYGKGHILITALYYDDTDEIKYIAGLKNTNALASASEREIQNEEIINLLKSEDVSIIGANLQYDLGWLLYEYGMSTYDVKCTFIDVLQAESLLNEFDVHTLESVSQKYLKYGKNKHAIEKWIADNVDKAKGDFRKYLIYAPYDLFCDYVATDAKNPVKIWKKQLTLLKEQDLALRTKLEFDCILPTLQMTMYGLPFDNETRKKHLLELVELRDKLKEKFEKQYEIKNFNVNSSKQIASLFDKLNIPYKYKITLKEYQGQKLVKSEDIDKAYNRAKQIVSDFRMEKSIPVAYIAKEMAERTCDLLTENGFGFNCSSNIDKKYFASQRENYELVALLADWKQANSIISKILGDEYERFVCPDNKVRPQFNITDTVSFRYSSNKPNFQQIPSKNGLVVDGKEFLFADKIRVLCTADKGCVFGKIDYGQIEYRLICNIACGEAGAEVRRLYAENPKMDFHKYVVDLTKLSRKYAKNMSFGVSFGMGLSAMAENFGWSIEKATEISEQYHQNMPFVKPTLELVGDVASKRGYIRTVCGSHARLKDKNKKYTMLNRYTQGSGAECLKSAIVKAYKEGLWERLKVANTVHDELNLPYLKPTKECMQDFYRLAELMRTAVEGLRVPLEAEIELGDTWANTKEVKDWLDLRNENAVEWQETSEELKQAIFYCEEILKEHENEQSRV